MKLPCSRLTLLACEDRLAPATFTVNALTDTGAGSGLAGDLRYCVTQANDEADYPGADTINFDSTLFGTAKTILLTGGQLPITAPVNIQGTSKTNVTINGNASGRIFSVSGA